MGRKGGLPASIIKKYGVSKKAWAVYRAGHGGRRARNPRRSHRTHKTHRRTHRVHHRRRTRRNPTGYAFSGSKFRPVFRRAKSGYRYAGRVSSLRGRSIRRSRRGMVGYHRRRRHNAASGYSHRRMFGGGSFGKIRDLVPLLRKSDWHQMKSNKMQAFAGGIGGFFVGGIMGQAGGTLAILGTGFIGGIIIRYALKGRGKWAAAAPGFVLGAIISAVSHVLTTGSLQGHAALGATARNLKMMAQRVKLRGLGGLAEVSLQGNAGVGQLDQLAARINKQLSSASTGLAIPGLKGLGDFRTGRKYSPVTQTGMGDCAADPQATQWSYSPN